MAAVRHRHPANIAHHERASFGEHIADRAAETIGSWRFLIIQTVAVACWVAGNLWLIAHHPFDPFPFVLLNLLFSVQAAYTGPVLLLAGNRQAQKDRLTLEHTFQDTEAILRRLDGIISKLEDQRLPSEKRPVGHSNAGTRLR